jgi:hypothetical protein
MKRVLAVAFAVAILSLGFNASAQTPFVQVFFDDYGQIGGAATCPPCGLGQIDQFSVFAVNFNMWIVAIEYTLLFPPAVSFTGDLIDPCHILADGPSTTGIAIGMPCPINGFSPARTQKVNVVWVCCDNGIDDPCVAYPNNAIQVLPYPGSGATGPRAVDFFDNTIIKQGVGMTSMICQTPIATKESTWGEVKALYNQ